MALTPVTPAAARPVLRAAPSFVARDLAEATVILRDDHALLELASKALGQPASLRSTLLGEEPLRLITQLSELTERRLIRQHARSSASKFVAVVESLCGRPHSGETEEALDAVIAAIWPAYMRHTAGVEGAEGSADVWATKLYLHVVPPAGAAAHPGGDTGGDPRAADGQGTALPGAPPVPPAGILTLYVRFTLSRDLTTGSVDLSLQVGQLAPLSAGSGPGFNLSWSVEDVDLDASDPPHWTAVDQGLRAKLSELQGMLGLARRPAWGPTGVLGLLLAACAGLPSCDSARQVLAQLRSAHREEMLAGA